jgi:hypothetical protein
MQSWATQIFSTKPVRPGYWKFTWEAGHGSSAWIDETVRFDRARQLFAETQTIRPYPGFAQAHCDLRIEGVPELLTAIGQAVPGFDDATGRFVQSRIDKTPPDRFDNAGDVVAFQGERVPLEVEWLIDDAREIGIEFTAASELVSAIQIQGRAWCSAD